MMTKKQHYINNKELYQALVDYQEEKRGATDFVPVPEYVGKAILLITQKLASRGNFSNYSYKDEMISDAIENSLAAVDNFNPDKYDNPFGYFSRISWFAFIRRIDREKRQNYLKFKNYRKCMAEEELINIGMGYYQPPTLTDEVTDQVITDYEENLKNRKEEKKRRERGIEKFVKDDDK